MYIGARLLQQIRLTITSNMWCLSNVLLKLLFEHSAMIYQNSGFHDSSCSLFSIKICLGEVVRLVDGEFPGEGRMETSFFGEWHRLTCYFLTIETSEVLCRQLGYSHFIMRDKRLRRTASGEPIFEWVFWFFITPQLFHCQLLKNGLPCKRTLVEMAVLRG